MLRFIVLFIALMMVAAIAVTLFFAALVFVAFACLIGIPLWLMARPHLQKRGIGVRRAPVERLKELYAEGKIDMLEFEQRVSRLVSTE